MSFVIIAHRGYSSEAPGNTIAAFDLALEAGFPHIEFDVQLCSDNIPVVIHDRTVDRTTNGSGQVNQISAADIQKLEAGASFENASVRFYMKSRVPTLQEVLDRYKGKAHLYIELKSEERDLPHQVAKLLDKNGWIKPDDPIIHSVPGVTIISFNLDQLELSKSLMPNVCIGWLIMELSEREIQIAKQNHFHMILPYVHALTHEQVKTTYSNGLELATWGVQNIQDFRHALQNEVFAIAVDWPRLALDLVNKRPNGN